MWSEALILTLCIFEIFSVYRPDVQIISTADKILFNCEDSDSFSSLEWFGQDPDNNITVIELIDCLKGPETLHKILEMHKLKSVTIKTNKDWFLNWFEKTPNTLTSLSFQSFYVYENFLASDCFSYDSNKSLNRLINLKKLELMLDGYKKRCLDTDFEIHQKRDFDFRNLTLLEHLKIRINAGMMFKDILLENQTNLKYLDLSGNRLETIPGEALKNKPKLKTLILAHNKLFHLPVPFHEMHELNALEYLDISYNNLSYLTNLTFPNLQVLNVSFNNLKEIHFIAPKLNTFVFFVDEIPAGIDMVNALKTPALSTIYTNYSCEASQHKIDKSLLPSIRKLKISFKCVHEIISISEDFDGLESLSYLEMDSAHKGTFSVQDYEFIENRSLFMEVMSLKRWYFEPNWPWFSLQALQNLKDLELKSCYNIPLSQRFMNSKLQRLDMSGSPFYEIRQFTFYVCMGLRSLKMKECQLAKIHVDAFSMQKLLEELDLSHNFLETLPAEIFRNTRNLKILNLSYNRIQSILDSTFKNLNRIVELNLARNQLEVFEAKNCKNLSMLQTLTLDGNKIQVFDFGQCIRLLNIDSSPAFRSLKMNFKANAFHYIDLVDVYHLAESFESIYIDINLQNATLKCDCEMFNSRLYAKVLQEKYPKYIFNWKCSNLGSALIETKEEELKCSTPRSEGGCEYHYRSGGIQVVNCSSRELREIRSLPPLPDNFQTIELNIENNLLENLLVGPSQNEVFQNITKIFAPNNSIEQILEDQLPKALKFLDISSNNFTSFRQIPFKKFKESGIKVNILKNNWTCTCEDNGLFWYFKDHSEVFVDFELLECLIGGTPYPINSITDIILCGPDNRNFYWIGGSLLLLLLLAISSALFYKFNHEIKVWCYARNCFPWWVSEEELDKDRIYDAFVSYSYQDEEYVLKIVEHLEGCENPYRLCLHFRDWRIGEYIPNQIITSVNQSKRTIFILTNSFVESTWAKLEFRAAAVADLKEKRSRVIIILCDDIENIDVLDEELQAYLKTNTYLKWNDAWFWDKLKYALPHRRGRAQNETHDGIELQNI